MAEDRDKEQEAGQEPEDAGQFYMERRPDLEPTEFRDGFTLRTLMGALFVAAVMMPGSIYLGLMVGQDLGPAAEWTTIILFTEIARRSLTVLTRQELYTMYYMAQALIHKQTMFALAGGAFAWLIWAGYIVNSPAADKFKIAEQLPTWFAPPLGSEAYVERTFFHQHWVIPIALVVGRNILDRMQWVGLGYFLFRTTSDVERLPFPIAPVAAQGATALAEVSSEEGSWRWSVFSVGTMVGLIYGVFYVGIPVITSGFLAEPLSLIPIPFIDLMKNTEDVFPAGRIGIGTELGLVFFGFVLPFPLVAGQFIGSVISNFIFAPALYRMNPDLFPTWQKGMSLIQSEMTLNFDMYLSIGIGIGLSIALIGIHTVMAGTIRGRMQRWGRQMLSSYRNVPEGRGDFPLWIALGLWSLSTITYIVVCHILVPDFPLVFLILFAFFWTPLISYMSARMLGLTGQPLRVPYVAQATFILSGYKGVDIWFAPVPFFDHGWAAQAFREIELTGTRITTIIKAEAVIITLMLISSFTYWSFFWRSSPIPSAQYPYAQTMWPLNAFFQCLWATATRAPEPGQEQPTFLIQALKFNIIAYSGVASLVLYSAFSVLKIPALWFYGLLAGFSQQMFIYIPMFIGGCLGKYYFAPRFGVRRWMQYAPVLAAGYTCGLGVLGMGTIGLTIIFKAVRSLPF